MTEYLDIVDETGEALQMVQKKLITAGFKISRAGYEDIGDILEIEKLAFEKLADKSWYVTDDITFMERHIEKEGFILKAAWEGRTAAFLAVRFPRTAEDSLFPYARDRYGIPQTERCLCAHMESVAVHPDFYGCRLLDKLLQAAVEEAAAHYHMKYMMATVHPENLFSRRGFESNGFTPIAEAVKYGGLNRLIYCKVC